MALITFHQVLDHSVYMGTCCLLWNITLHPLGTLAVRVRSRQPPRYSYVGLRIGEG
jgi:hypothetical protein